VTKRPQLPIGSVGFPLELEVGLLIGEVPDDHHEAVESAAR
jgi:hypothetical protein